MKQNTSSPEAIVCNDIRTNEELEAVEKFNAIQHIFTELLSAECRGTRVMEILVKLTSNFSLFYLLNYFHPWEKHTISVSIQLRKPNSYELWDKGFFIEI